MTIRDAIELVDLVKPNQYDEKLKIMWLSKHDGQVFEEVFKTHVNCPKQPFVGYGVETSRDTVLLVPEPYAMDVYNYFLQAQIDKENGEIDKFNQDIILYNNAYQAYLNAYNRQNMPLYVCKRFRF